MMMMMDNNYDSDDDFLGSCYKEGVSCGSKGKGGQKIFVSWRHFNPWLSETYHRWRGDWPHNHHHLDHDEHPFARTHATQGDEEAHGILEGISSLHSWIKTQTMIRWVLFVFVFLSLPVFFLFIPVFFLFSFPPSTHGSRHTPWSGWCFFLNLLFFLYLLVFSFSYQITQYSTRPTKLGKKKDDMSFDDVSIPKLERFTFFSGRRRWRCDKSVLKRSPSS